MQLVSVNVGLPQELTWQNRQVSTGIFKSPVEGRIQVHTLNLEGDAQADLSVHGGVSKAVYVYASEHYDYWRTELPDVDFTWGHFGENLTTVGLAEDDVYIGDTFRIGSAVFQVTEPRMPCYKLGLRFERADMVKRFLLSRRNGFYLAVIEEGQLQVGDTIERLTHNDSKLRVSDIVRLYAFDKTDWTTMQRAVEVEALPESWRVYFQERLEKHQQA